MDLESTFFSRNDFTDEWEAQWKRYRRNEKSLFALGSYDVRLTRLDEKYCTEDAVLALVSETEVEDYLSISSNDSFLILSFFQRYSIGPLKCNESTMTGVIRNWKISSMFLDVLQKFGDQPQIFQESSGARQSFIEDDGSFELSYQLMYVESNGKSSPHDPWSFRQTGAHHKHSVENNFHRVILLHPNDRAIAQSRLKGHAQSCRRAALANHPLNVHLMVLSSYLINWQDYIESLAKELETIRRDLDVADTTAARDAPIIQPDRLQDLRHIEDKIVCKTCRCLRSTIVLIHTLRDVNNAIPNRKGQNASVHRELLQFEQRLEGHINAAEILAQRVQATLGLLTNLLDVENQAISNKISTRILQLTRDSVDDNATVRVITVCTLIYLPASFVASILGMNLFDYKEEGGALRISNDFWIYFVATIPLTFVTLGAWFYYKKGQDRKRKLKYDLEQQLQLE